MQAHAANGTLFPQPRVVLDGRTGLMDDIVGGGLRVIASADVAPEALLASPAVIAAGATVILVSAAGAKAVAAPAGVAAVIEQDDIVTDWFARQGACIALVRPDHYVYGVASNCAAFEQVVAAFNQSLGANP